MFPAQSRPRDYRSTQLRMAYELSKIDMSQVQMYWITVAYGSARQLDYAAAARDFDLLIGRLRREAKNEGSDLVVFDAQERDSGGSWHMHALIAATKRVMTRRSLAAAWGRTIRREADIVRVSCEAVRCEEELRPRKLYLLKAGSRHVQARQYPDTRQIRGAMGDDKMGAFEAAAPGSSDADREANRADAPTENENIPTLLQGCNSPDAVWHIRATDSQLSRIQAEARERKVWLTRSEFEAIRIKYFPLTFESARVKRLRRWVDEDSARFSAFSAWLDIWTSHQQAAQPRNGVPVTEDDIPAASPATIVCGHPSDEVEEDTDRCCEADPDEEEEFIREDYEREDW